MACLRCRAGQVVVRGEGGEVWRVPLGGLSSEMLLSASRDSSAGFLGARICSLCGGVYCSAVAGLPKSPARGDVAIYWRGSVSDLATDLRSALTEAQVQALRLLLMDVPYLVEGKTLIAGGIKHLWKECPCPVCQLARASQEQNG